MVHFLYNKMQHALLYFVCWFFSAKLVESQNINSTTSSNSSFTENYLTKPGCPSKCGNVTIPFPFGIGIGCSLNSWFDVYCPENSDNYTGMYVSGRKDLHLIDISKSTIRIRTNEYVEFCYGKSPHNLTLDFSNTPYSLSEANMLTLVGCSYMVIVEGDSMPPQPQPRNTERKFASGCVSICSDGDEYRKGSCPGNGCCQIPIPKGTVFLNASISGLQDRLGYKEKHCGYAFFGQQGNFSFAAVSDLYKQPFTVTDRVKTVPVILDWWIGNVSCQGARNYSSYACQKNTDCIDAEAGVGGYRCRCEKGLMGNPYLPPGCVDIDDSTSVFPVGAEIAIFTGSSLLTLIPLAIMLTRFVKNKKEKQKIRKKFFKQNGGLILTKESSSSSNQVILRKSRIFTAKELEKATDNFNESRILGQGGQGTVYKGMLSDGQLVAVKKSKLVEENKSKHLVEQFINEVVIMSLISHRNVVKLLGCCLEMRVPHLVYEFMPNGTLSELIQGKHIEFPFIWPMRLKIAADVARAVAYLHSATSVAIFHRDVKSSNILLDEKFVPKVSDFGTSKSIEVDRTHLTTMISGTFGYIDPEYFQSSQFTEKSDVYSFGVVLVELLTGLKPIMASSNTEDVKSLVYHFLSKMEENTLESILECEVSEEGEKKEAMAVAELAKMCLHSNGKQRPTMKEVAMELEGVRKSHMGLTYNTTLPGDSAAFHSAIFSIEHSEYNWTAPDFGITSLSDVCPIMHDTI